MPTRFPYSRFLSVLFVSLLASFGLSAWAEVLVVTDSSHPVQASPDVRVIELDRAAHIETALSADLPTDPEQAANLARQRLQDLDLQRRLQSAYQGIADAKSLNVLKIPAVVVDRRYVVYGETNVARAIARIETYRSTQP
jgi:integrating conjugative element protein (TIGR03757 family)